MTSGCNKYLLKCHYYFRIGKNIFLHSKILSTTFRISTCWFTSNMLWNTHASRKLDSLHTEPSFFSLIAKQKDCYRCEITEIWHLWLKEVNKVIFGIVWMYILLIHIFTLGLHLNSEENGCEEEKACLREYETTYKCRIMLSSIWPRKIALS